MKEILYRIYSTLTKEQLARYTVWDLFLDATNLSPLDRWLLTLRVDLPLLFSLVDGHSPTFLARRYGLSAKTVYEIAQLWGIVPFDVSLTFSVFSIYEPDMSVETFISVCKELFKATLFKQEARKIIYNVERYNDLTEILKEFYEDFRT